MNKIGHLDRNSVEEKEGNMIESAAGRDERRMLGTKEEKRLCVQAAAASCTQPYA